MYEELKKVIQNSDNIVFFGGAGVSTESNIPDFRSSKGIFNEKNKMTYSPETVVSHNFFITNPEFFYDFYKSKMVYPDAKPNKAHIALANLEKAGKLKAIITQNIDGLHQMAGSKNVLELHGTIHKNTCTKCAKKFELDYIIKSDSIPKCDECGGTIKPDVVLYGESLDSEVIDKSIYFISQADVLIIGGTSLVVYPAAGFIRYFKGSKLVLINKSETAYDRDADIVIHDSIGQVMDYCQ